MSGDFAVSNGIISAASGTKTTLSCNVSESATSKVYTLIVPETSFASGFSIKILNGSSEELYTKSTSSNSISVGRAKIKPMAPLTVPVSLYVRDNSTGWDAFQGYYYTSTGNSAYDSTWGTDGLSGSFTHNGNTYKRITLNESENGKEGTLIIHNYKASGESPVERITISSISLDQDHYYTAAGDGAWRIYICDGLNWSGEHLRAWGPNNDSYEIYTGTKNGGGKGHDGTETLYLEFYNYEFKYWAGPNSNDMVYYQLYKSDYGESTNSYGITKDGSAHDIVFNAYYDAGEHACKLVLIGTGHVALLSED